MGKMIPFLVFIEVRDREAHVAQYRRVGRRLTWVYAVNCGELKSMAARKILIQGGRLEWEGHYSCPKSLAVLAKFEDDAPIVIDSDLYK